MADHVDELEDGHIVNHVNFLVERQVGSLMNQAHEQVDTTQLTTTSNDEITESIITNGHTYTVVPEPTDMIEANCRVSILGISGGRKLTATNVNSPRWSKIYLRSRLTPRAQAPSRQTPPGMGSVSLDP